MRLTEKYDLKRLCYAYENLEKIIDKKSYDECGSYYKLILQKFIINDGEQDINYKYAEYTNYGRRYSNGIQPFKTTLKNFLLKGSDVVDIDMKTAHPSILQHICDIYNIKTKYLKEYVLNKEAVLNKHFEIELHAGQDIKKKILTATNMDKPFQTKNDWLKSYIHEIGNIKEQLINHKDFAKIKKDAGLKKQDSKNMNSSILNRILCKYESEIMDIITETIESNGYKPLCLMFDGLLTHCPHDKVDELIEDLNEFIQEQYSPYIRFEKKPYDSDVEMGDYEMDISRVHESIDSKETRTKLFYDLFDPIKVIHPCMYGIKKQDGLYEFYDKAKFIQSVEHIKYGLRNEEGIITGYKSVVFDFFEEVIDPKRIKQEIINQPEYEGETNYNLWRDWSIKELEVKDYEYDKKAVDYYKYHLSSLCNHEENIVKAMNEWIAHMFKYPRNKSFVPIFVGRQGAGKDLFIAWLTLLMGEHKVFESISPEKDIWGDFNPMMKNAFLVHLSEFGRRNTQEYTGQIKGLTTSKRIRINEKNKTQYFIESFHRFLGASNYNEPIPIEADNRRYMLIMTSPEHINKNKDDKKKYFDYGWGLLKDMNAMKSIFEYIMSFEPPIDLNYHMVEDSDYMKYIKQISKLPEEMWLDEFIKLEGVEDEVKKYKLLDLYTNYKEWSKRNKKSFTYEERKFSINLKALITQTTKGVETQHCREGNYFVFDYNALKHEGYYKYGIDEEEPVFNEINSNEENSDFEG